MGFEGDILYVNKECVLFVLNNVLFLIIKLKKCYININEI